VVSETIGMFVVGCLGGTKVRTPGQFLLMLSKGSQGDGDGIS
jgi:hypothetical protein